MWLELELVAYDVLTQVPKALHDKRADYGMVREGRKVTGLGLKASIFNDIDLQPGTLRNSGILNLSLVVHVIKKAYLSR